MSEPVISPEFDVKVATKVLKAHRLCSKIIEVEPGRLVFQARRFQVPLIALDDPDGYLYTIKGIWCDDEGDLETGSIIGVVSFPEFEIHLNAVGQVEGAVCEESLLGSSFYQILGAHVSIYLGDCPDCYFCMGEASHPLYVAVALGKLGKALDLIEAVLENEMYIPKNEYQEEHLKRLQSCLVEPIKLLSSPIPWTRGE